MKNFYLLLICLSLIPFISLAQSNYKPGYVVKLNGDTVKGYIDYQTWNKTPKTINFKTGLDSGTTATSFSTANTSSFTITGADRYMRFVIKISEDAVTGFSVSTGVNTKEIVDTVFLKVLNSGKYVTLYGYADKIKTRYFIDENNGLPFELGLHEYINPNEPGETKRSESYKRQLESYAIKYQPKDEFLLSEIKIADYKEAI